MLRKLKIKEVRAFVNEIQYALQQEGKKKLLTRFLITFVACIHS